MERTDERTPTGAATTEGSAPGRLVSAASGLLAGAAALGIGELVGGFRAAWQGPVVSVAEAVIDAVPRPVKDFGIETFGANDKIALIVGILIFSVIFAAVLGLIARRRLAIGAAGFAIFAAVGIWASQQLVGTDVSATIPSIAAGLAGIAALTLLIRAATPTPAPVSVSSPSPLAATTPVIATQVATPERPPTTTTPVPTTTPASPAGPPTPPEMPTVVSVDGRSSRRRFLLVSAAVAAVAAGAAATGRGLRNRFSAAESRSSVVLPPVADPLAAAPATVSIDTAGASPFFTPNANFYRVDTALAVPQVQAESWSLRVTGLVDREIELSFADMLDRALVEEDITLTCVSNTVGGGLVGTARWLGLPLRDLLDEAGVDPSADQIIGRSVDGYTCGFPIEAAYDRPALIAIGMNGEPLPIEHGFPARLMVPGLYGYVSATKWLTEIELSRFDAFDQYWVERGWDKQAPIKLMSRIDTPRTLGKVTPGAAVIGGVAWAQTIGISKVEVAIDDGEFAEAELADELNLNTWRQWKLGWDATPGRHRLTVRATDANGQLQTDARADPFPNGASGWMSIFVDVTDA